MTDRERESLRGPVLACRTTSSTRGEGRRTSSSHSLFTAKGALVSRDSIDATQYQQVLQYRYDESERPMERSLSIRFPREDGGVAQRSELQRYRYDEQGRLVAIHDHHGGSEPRINTSLQYNGDGTLGITSYRSEPFHFFPAPAGTHGRYSEQLRPHIAIVMILCDADHRPVRRVLYDQNDAILSRWVFHYNDRGLLAEEGEWIAGAFDDDAYLCYRYDDQDRVIRTEEHKKSGRHKVFSYAYNVQGDVDDEEATMTNLDGHPMAWHLRHHYIYNQSGDWTEKQTFSHSRGDPHIAAVSKRELTYCESTARSCFR